MRALSDNNITLLVLDLVEQLAQRAHLFFQRVLRRLGFGHVDDTVHVERDVLGRRRPLFVAEAVDELAVESGVEAVVAGGYSQLRDYVSAGGVLDLGVEKERVSIDVNGREVVGGFARGEGNVVGACTQWEAQ